MIEAIPSLAAAALEIFHQTGEADRERVAAAYAAAGLRAEVVAFEPRHAPALPLGRPRPVSRGRADGRGARAWRRYPRCSSPTPTPRTTTSGRTRARWLGAGAARVLEPATLSGTQVAGVLRELFAAPGELASMSAAARQAARSRTPPSGSSRSAPRIARARRLGDAA